MYIFLLLHFVYLLCVCIYVCAFTVCCAVLWRSKDNLQESFLSFHHMGPGDPTQVMKIGGKYLYLPSCLASWPSSYDLYVEQRNPTDADLEIKKGSIQENKDSDFPMTTV